MQIKVMLFISEMQREVGWSEKEIYIPDAPAFTVESLFKGIRTQSDNTLHHLVSQNEEPQPGKLIFVNGREIRLLDGFKTGLKDRDTVIVLTAVGGG